MAQYNYRCSRCNRLFASTVRADAITCQDCQGQATRKFSFYIAGGLQEHFNTAVGEYVSTRRQMEDALKRKSEEASARLGIDHDFQYLSPAEMADMDAHGVENPENALRNQHDHPEMYLP